MGRFIDLTNKKFGRLTALKRVANRGDNTMWECSCVCGGKAIVSSGHLSDGHTNSCGCYRADRIVAANTKHGMSGDSFYHLWHNITRRCAKENNQNYDRYGGRGIKVCDRWLKFENFKDDMYDSYVDHCKIYSKKNTSIDRINNNGNYEKNNCRWATRAEQTRNYSRNVVIKHDGENYRLKDLHKKLNLKISYDTFHDRIRRRGMSLKEAITTPNRYAKDKTI